MFKINFKEVNRCVHCGSDDLSYRTDIKIGDMAHSAICCNQCGHMICSRFDGELVWRWNKLVETITCGTLFMDKLTAVVSLLEKNGFSPQFTIDPESKCGIIKFKVFDMNEFYGNELLTDSVKRGLGGNFSGFYWSSSKQYIYFTYKDIY